MPLFLKMAILLEGILKDAICVDKLVNFLLS
jgi:hypothetical protein